MSRLAKIDTDCERLPSGMRRVAYDADTQRYTYKDPTDDSLWEGAEGARYGLLRRKTISPQRLFSDHYDNDLLPPYQQHPAGNCTRTNPSAHCSCYFCKASVAVKPPMRERSSSLVQGVQSVAQTIKRSVSVRASKPSAPK
ncbi:hypothetical protein EJ05DRAFT_482787 [Pseudovirgaria hyperparasitica]|uniref:Uncharacterized protein n=1 Tax=Pseudovirgaria hyperparasitica TaxID=470096 RepID=A0A6A6WIL0_9PEZI|nr:uncharacterized protein EJ05DRAFT_482787 [Pseudovirgaria hyperparasitica]KAF2761985.1 hypothetical protein EJ05DRAFT_482787 [Pseudovirgaria hyperparasitica]